MKSETKKTPVLRFRDFNSDWTTSKLADATTYVDYRGKTPPKTESGVFLVTAKNIKVGHIDYECSKEYIPKEHYDEVMRRGRPRLGDVLITTEAPLGNVASIDRIDIALAQRIIKLRGKERILSNQFLKHVLLSQSFQKLLNEKSTGSTAKGIKGSVLHKLPLPFPSIAEQEKIAGFLSVVDEKIGQLAKKKEALFKFKKGVMQQIFDQHVRFKDDNGKEFPDWEEKKLGDLGSVFSGGTPQTTTHEYYEGEIPFIRSAEINSNTTAQFISIDGLRNSSAKRVEVGDLLYAMYGANSGEVGICRVDGAINQAILCLRTELDNIFLYSFLIHTKAKIVSKFVQGGQGNLSAELVKSFKVPVPQMKEQMRIAGLLSSIDEKMNLVNTQLEKTRAFKKGLLQQMFI
ncbi:MAG: type restriction enzyme subunit [Blastocatellia bacterium]|jgi:type I restriction enzyme S subunit|nr:type restriction enzyme subunit [Blastocatellia bacterium]